MILCIPPIDSPLGPTLGPQVWAWIRRNLCYGPGDLIGKPIKDDAEWFAILCRLYSVWPPGHEFEGRRIYQRGAISRRKGRAKTELGAWIALAELHGAAPVRCVGWHKNGEPKGGPVTDPYIPLVAYTEDQGEVTIYGALYEIAQRSAVASDFDIGKARIKRRDGTGTAEALAAEPNARDGARTTFQVFEETHRWYTPRLKHAYQTMMLNMPKRRGADAWSLEVTTSFCPGQGSIAESTYEHAKSVAEGRSKDTRLFFTHRQAPDDADITTPDGLRAAVIEASGEVAAGWSNIEGICSQFSDPNLDHSTLCRLWLNQVVRGSDRAFNVKDWDACELVREIPDRAAVTLGFDGSRFSDATAIVVTEISSGHQELAAIWEHPPTPDPEWEVPAAEVTATIDDLFRRFKVKLLYADPPYWEDTIGTWASRWGEKRVVLWPTLRYRKMALAVQAFCSAIKGKALTHGASKDYRRHIGNCVKREMQGMVDEETKRPLFILQKVRPVSPDKIDAAAAGVLSWQARLDALPSSSRPSGSSVYDTRGVLTY